MSAGKRSARFGVRVASTLLGVLIATASARGGLLLLDPSSAAEPDIRLTQASTYYVRTDGGSAPQCTGLVDAPYPGNGSGQPCAWDHPFRALPPGGSARILGGDLLIIGRGSYMMGYGAPGSDECDTEGAFECHMSPIPSGRDAAHATRVVGAGWDVGCPSPPELWGTERPWLVVNLTDASYVVLACLEITDHSGCVEDHTGGLACTRDEPPFGAWADTGVYAEDSTGVRLKNLDIHGLAVAGVRAGRLTDWTVEDVRIAGNGWVGWEGDIDGDDSNSGEMIFRRLTVEWNGCAETHPGGVPTGCWGQSAGGYGDGLGTGRTGGHWIIEDSVVQYNTSDGLDLLYTREEGSQVDIRRTVSRGNAGDQIKMSGPATIENVLAVSNCGFFQSKPFAHNVDYCRSGGSAISLDLRPGNQVTVINSTVTGQGDCLVIAECQEDATCNGSESVLLRNSIFQGNPEFEGGGDTTCFTWYGTAQDPFTIEHSIINEAKSIPVPCPTGSLCGVSPGLVDKGIDTFDPHLVEGSPALDRGTSTGAPAVDLEGRPRVGQPDIGAYERWEPTSRLYVPLTECGGGRRSNIGPYLLSNPEAGQPTHNLLKTGNMRAYTAISPADWGSQDSLPNMEGYGRNWIPAEQEMGMIWQGAEGGRRYFDKFKDSYRATRDDIHAWMSTWAFIYGDDAFARQWVAFQREWLRLMHQDGFRAGVGGMRTHMFRTGEITWLAPAIADSDYLFLSEADAPTLMYGRGDSTFLYRALVQELRQELGEDGVPELILDVAVDGKVLKDLNRSGADWKRGYIHYGTTKESYMSDVRAYDRETLRDPYVRHVFWFATNYNSRENESFDVDTYMLSVANSWHVE